MGVRHSRLRLTHRSLLAFSNHCDKDALRVYTSRASRSVRERHVARRTQQSARMKVEVSP